MLQFVSLFSLLLLLSAPSPGRADEPHHGLLHVEFVQYAVPDSRLASGHYCDSLFFLKKRVSPCDPQVNLCVGPAGDFKSCSVAKIALPWIKNSDSVNFGSKIGGMSNPVTQPFSKLPEALSLSSTIYDHDRVGSADLIETLQRSSVTPTKSKQTVQLSHRTHLRILWISCATNYYGSTCCRLFNHCHHQACCDDDTVAACSTINSAASFRGSCQLLSRLRARALEAHNEQARAG
uniref:Extracellular protein n=1 Tax=Macrostomum lignano TaxID=282301 RepID=A0A1I8F589_9PLAT